MTPVELKEKKETAPTPTPAPTPAAATPRTPVAPRAPKGTKNVARVLLTATDGKIEWKNMSPESRKLIEELFKNPEFLKQFGITGTAADSFKPEQCGALFDAFTMVFQTMCKLLLKFPPAALQCLAYSESDKKMLAQPTADVLNKFAPKMLAENKELLMFAAVFLSVTQQKFAEAKKVAAAEWEKMRAARDEKARANPNSTVRVVAPVAREAENENGAAREVIPTQIHDGFLSARPAAASVSFGGV